MQYFQLSIVIINRGRPQNGFNKQLKMAMMKKVFLMMSMLLSLGMFSSCNNDDDTSTVNNERKDVSLTRAEQTLVSQSNGFAFRLFDALQGDKSMMVSPVSVVYALGMLNNGAAGETKAQINEVLGFKGDDADGVNAFCKKLLDEAMTLDRKSKLMIANNIYVNKDYELQSAFVQKVREYYQASPERLDFSNPSTLGTINRWASDHTEGIIGNVLNEIDPSTVSYLLNAIYFKGEWAAPFDKGQTKKEVFFGGKNLVDMMNCKRKFDYAESEDLQALRMPYGNGAYSMTILLPRAGKSLSDILDIMTAEEWTELTTALSEALVDVKMPKFETTTEVCLNEVLSDLGMPKAFTSQAEFPDFCNVPTFIGFCKQSSQIKVDEEGTVAAVVTTTVMDTEYVQAERAEFHATRPFIYVISEKSTGAIFFIGSYKGD